MICLLGAFRVLCSGRPVALRGGGKAEALLQTLALRRDGASREGLLTLLWPDHDLALAGQSLSSLIYSLHKLVGGALDGASLVERRAGTYRLNDGAGVEVDVDRFDAFVRAGDQEARLANREASVALYRRALALYGGNLCGGADVHEVVERERLRARCLTVLARLAEHEFAAGDYETALALAFRMLALDPCREDGHRLVMRCHIRRGERAQALRQFRVCEAALRGEFDASPEPATLALFDQVRLEPASV